MATTTPATRTDLKDFFSAAEARIDRWRDLSAVGRTWEAGVIQGQGLGFEVGERAGQRREGGGGHEGDPCRSGVLSPSARRPPSADGDAED